MTTLGTPDVEDAVLAVLTATLVPLKAKVFAVAPNEAYHGAGCAWIHEDLDTENQTRALGAGVWNNVERPAVVFVVSSHGTAKTDMAAFKAARRRSYDLLQAATAGLFADVSLGGAAQSLALGKTRRKAIPTEKGWFVDLYQTVLVEVKRRPHG